MTHCAQNRSEKSQNYLPWFDWPRAVDVLETVCARSGGALYSGRVLAESVHVRGAVVLKGHIEAARGNVLSLPCVVVDAISTGETVTIRATSNPAEPVWLANLRDVSLSKDTEILGETVRSIMNSIKPDNHAAIDQQLASVNVANAAPSHLLAVLTSLFTWREVLPQWGALRDRAFEHYKAQQVKGVDRAFKGLM